MFFFFLFLNHSVRFTVGQTALTDRGRETDIIIQLGGEGRKKERARD